MVEEIKFFGPTKCHNCESENIIGPYKHHSSVIIGFFTSALQEAYVCVECGYTMVFVDKKHRHKIDKEYTRLHRDHS